MSALAAYRWMPTPCSAAGPPLPAIVNRPSTKSTEAPSPGIGSGFQRNWSGVTGPSPKSLWKALAPPYEAKCPCIAAGRIRYSQLRRFSLRGAVNAVPLSCSAYSPCATRCGEFRPTGNAPSSASVSNEFPNPDWYSIATPGRAFLQDAALDMVALDGLEQGLEVALAEAFVALALDDLEEDRAERVLGEDLQQLALLGLRVGIDQDCVAAQALDVLAMVRHALVDNVEVGIRRVEEGDARLAHLLHRFVDVDGEQRDVLAALALVLAQVLVDLALLVAGLVERDAHHAVGRGHRLGQQAGLGALDVEVADLAEVEQLLVVIRPLLHVAQEQVVGQVVDEGQAEALRGLVHAL